MPYRLSLTVFDGVISKSDTVVITVIDSITFLVLKPVAGDRIVIGDSVVIRWQIVVPFSQTMIDLSVNKGKSWDVMTVPSILHDTQWVWHVDRTLKPYDSCLIQIRDYNNANRVAVSGYFALKK
jgi:hypothetical protein